jgi:5'-deoxynucleotidase YfbR-like HD superfamily hydrolase
VDNMGQIATIRAGGKVKRCHTLQTIKTQTVAEHSWGVALLVHKFFPSCNKAVILAALTHDISEVITGDVPADVKWKSEGLKNILDDLESEVNKTLEIDFFLAEESKIALKLCDSLELLLFCAEELFMGNRNMLPVANRLMDHMNKSSEHMPPEFLEYYNSIVEIFKDAKK